MLQWLGRMRRLAFAILWVALSIPLLAAMRREEPEIVDLTAVLDGRQVLVSFRLDGAFDDEVRERVETGLPTGFTYLVDLARDRKRWWDDQLAESRLEVVAMYNAVTREYLVNTKQDGKLVDSRTVRETAELEAALTRFTAVPAFAVPEIEPGQRLLVRVQAQLGSKTWLGFIPTTVETPRAESRKFRLPVDQP